MHIEDYPYEVITESDKHRLEELEPGAVVIDSEEDVCVLRYDEAYAANRWFVAGDAFTYVVPSLPCIVLVQEFGPDDYPQDWFEMGGEEL